MAAGDKPSLSVASLAEAVPASPAQSTPRSAILRTLFVYGPLMADEAVNALLGRVPPSRPATLPGHVRCCKRGRDETPGICSTHRGLVHAGYPAAIATGHESDAIEGVLFERLRPQEMSMFDHYEDNDYLREHVRVVAANGFGGQEEVECLVYLWPRAGATALNLEAPWAYTDFRTRNMQAFIEQVIKPCRRSYERENGQLEVQMTARESARSARSAQTPVATQPS